MGMNWLDEIPGNRGGFEALEERVRGGDAIAFVGAGASAGMYPLWGGLLEDLAATAVKLGQADQTTVTSWKNLAARKPRQVASQIETRIGKPAFRRALAEIFGPRPGPDQKRYTPVHGTLVRLPLKGVVSTNYDAGLLEARHELLPEVTATSFGVWNQEDACQAWLHGDAFGADQLPVLFAHGMYNLGDSIVLTAESYREAYAPGVYRRLFDHLWGTQQLFFVGFGFSDPFLDYIAENVVSEIGAAARHVALIGFTPEQRPTEVERSAFRDEYGVEPVFYPIRDGHDHGALQELLTALGPRPPAEPPAGPPAGADGAGRDAGRAEVPTCWTHETTNDDFFTGRADARERLSRWAGDSSVRAIGVTGMGGLGKTSLIGHWLKRGNGLDCRAYAGLFLWSFYADRSIDGFCVALVDFASRTLGLTVRSTSRAVRPVDAALAVLRAAPICLVLDGMEVLQERPGHSDYGYLLDPDLRELLDGACRQQDGLAILTSRFPFPDLTTHLGNSLRTLDLAALPQADGAALLEVLGVGGVDVDRREVSRRLEGHPLALRLFARAASQQAHGDPSFRIQLTFDAAGLRDDQPLADKLKRLLAFYEEGLDPVHSTLLSLVALFSTPVATDALQALCTRLELEDLPQGLDAPGIARRLDELAHHGLVLKEPGAPEYSAHPILRDHFRRRLLDVAAPEAASLLSDVPARDQIRTVDQIRPLLDAIALLCDAGHFEEADELYRRIGNPPSLFMTLPAPRAGLDACLGFISDESRRQRCEAQLPARRLGFYMNGAGLWAMHAGEYELARAWLSRRLELRSGASPINCLENLSELQILRGDLGSAAELAQQAASLDTDDGGPIAILASTLGWVGRVDEALDAFAMAQGLCTSGDLNNHPACLWALFLVTLGQHDRARTLTEWNRSHCAQRGWADDVAKCDLILGRLEQDPVTSLRFLRQAEATFRRARMLSYLPSALVALADRRRLDGAFAESIAHAQEALDLSAPRSYRLLQCNALVARGRARLAWYRTGADAAPPGSCESAEDDAGAALSIARRCEYAWGERDAIELQHAVALQRNELSRAKPLEAELRSLRERLRLPDGYVWPRADCWDD